MGTQVLVVLSALHRSRLPPLPQLPLSPRDERLGKFNAVQFSILLLPASRQALIGARNTGKAAVLKIWWARWVYELGSI